MIKGVARVHGVKYKKKSKLKISNKDDNMQIRSEITPDENASIVALRYLFLCIIGKN